MASVLTMNATIECSHKGSVTPSSSAKLKVDGKSVLLKDSVNGKSVSATCTNKDASKSQTQCKTATVTGTLASKLKAGGQAVLLDPLVATTDSTPAAGTASVTGGTQSKLTAK